jgi:hypothetical protein
MSRRIEFKGKRSSRYPVQEGIGRMRPEHERPSSHRSRRRRAAGVELLETRDLPTFVLVHHPASAAAERAAQAALQSVGSDTAAPALVTDVTDPGTPTPRQLALDRFHAVQSGSFNRIPPRFSNEAAEIFSIGKGTSNQALVMDYQVRLSIPSDPGRPVTGVISLQSLNVATTGTTLILDLTAQPASTVNSLPRHFTWTVDPASAGIYTNAGGYGTGSGTLDITYSRVVQGRGGRAAGHMGIVTSGLINVGMIFNVIGNVGNIPKNP